jgi:hypothetical protein
MGLLATICGVLLGLAITIAVAIDELSGREWFARWFLAEDS